MQLNSADVSIYVCREQFRSWSMTAAGRKDLRNLSFIHLGCSSHWRSNAVQQHFYAWGGRHCPAEMLFWPELFCLPPPALDPGCILEQSWPSWWVYPTSSSQLSINCCSNIQYCKKWRKPPQSHRRSLTALPGLQMTSASSAGRVCSDPSCKEHQCCGSSPVYCLGEHPGTYKSPLSQCPLPHLFGNLSLYMISIFLVHFQIPSMIVISYCLYYFLWSKYTPKHKE